VIRQALLGCRPRGWRRHCRLCCCIDALIVLKHRPRRSYTELAQRDAVRIGSRRNGEMCFGHPTPLSIYLQSSCLAIIATVDWHPAALVYYGRPRVYYVSQSVETARRLLIKSEASSVWRLLRLFWASCFGGEESWVNDVGGFVLVESLPRWGSWSRGGDSQCPRQERAAYSDPSTHRSITQQPSSNRYRRKGSSSRACRYQHTIPPQLYGYL